MNTERETYLGDGLFASWDGFQIKLRAPREGGGYLAWVPELPGCMSDGDTPEQAFANAQGAIDEWIAEAIRLNRAVPAPTRKQAVR